MRHPSEEHGDPLGHERVSGVPEDVRKLDLDPPVVDAVAQLVENRAHPARRRLEIEQNPDVALAVDVDTERVLVLPVPLLDVGALEDRSDVETDAVEELVRDPE
jgi:hypothetical protein